MKLVYVCHPFAADPAGTVERVRHIVAHLVRTKVLPVAPHLYLPQLFDEATQRDEAMEACLEMLRRCDAVFVYGEPSVGMVREIEEANRLRIPVVYREQSGG
jgi:hypothetical protein